MASNVTGVASLSPDILLLIFEQLVDDATSLCNVGLTSNTWRSLSLPCLLRKVDLSSHNNGRVPEHERPVILPVLYADFSGAYRPRNLVSRQRAFLRLMTARPNLTKHVRSLTWTLIWRDFDDHSLTEIDRQTWTVFSQMTNVSRLDLASLHDVHDDNLVRRNPVKLFPAVTSLRLLGWMHRGLVKAIITSLDASQLRTLELDYLEDEGALPDGAPINMEVADEYAHHARSTNSVDVIHDDLFQRQQTNKAYIFPGPMWLPLRTLAECPLDFLTHLQVKIAPFSMDIDSRNYYTFFQETARLIRKARGTLQSLVVVLGEPPLLNDEFTSQCGTSRIFLRHTYRPWYIKLAAALLRQVLTVLNQGGFQRLRNITFQGFRVLEAVSHKEASDAQLASVFQAIQASTIAVAIFTEISEVDHRSVFLGYDCEVPDLDVFRNALDQS